MNNKHYLPTALLVTALSLLANAWFSAPPSLSSANAPATEFSGMRAMGLLEEFLQENVPHPLGSLENQRIKARIQDWLGEQGIPHQEQRTWACRQQRGLRCGFVENIVATIPGREAGPYVALMAHYDSVPAAPGAGDDMAGVVAVLETARAIKATGTTSKPILLLITDGEESGLHGAEAFFSQHPLASQIGVLLNVEGSGTRGASGVLRTSTANRWFMETLAKNGKGIQGSSFAAEIFKRMPNDTDFSVSDAAGVPGIDFAFAAERVHYHTPNDRAGILDPRTVEDHGRNLHPLALALANGYLPMPRQSATSDEVVFQDLFGAWVQWPAQYSWLLLAAAVALLLAASLSLQGQKWQLFFAATLIPTLALCAALGAGYGASRGLEHFNGVTVEWPASLWAFRLTIGTAALLACCVFAAVFSKRFSVQILLLGVWWFIAILVFLLLLLLSEAAGVYLALLLPAALLLCLSSCLRLPGVISRLLEAATLIPAVILLGAARQTEDALGYTLVLAPLAFLGLYLVLALPFFRGAWLLVLSAISGIALLVGGFAASSQPLYSDFRPQHVNIRHYEDADTKVAYWRVLTDGQIPASLAAILDFETTSLQLYPWSDDPVNHLAEAAYEGKLPPQLELLDSTPTGDGREVSLRIAAQNDAWNLSFILPVTAKLQRINVGGVDIEFTPENTGEKFVPIDFYGTQNQDVMLRLVLGSKESVQGYLAAYSTTLPNDGVKNARPVEATPVHSGDLSAVWRRVSF